MTGVTSYNHIHGTHSSEGKGDRGERTSDRTRTRDLRSIAEFQPREQQRDWSRSFVPHCSYVLVTGVPLSSDT